MSRRPIEFGMAGLLFLAAASAAPLQAADLPYEGDRYGSAYEDPRYADIYGHEKRQPRVYSYRQAEPAPRDYGRYEERIPVPKAPVYREDDRYFGGRAPTYDRFARRSACPTKDEIRDELERDGWRDFHAPRVIDQKAAIVNARRPSGRLFELTVDRCTGTVLEARPLEPRRFGPYADRGGVRGYRY